MMCFGNANSGTGESARPLIRERRSKVLLRSTPIQIITIAFDMQGMPALPNPGNMFLLCDSLGVHQGYGNPRNANITKLQI